MAQIRTYMAEARRLAAGYTTQQDAAAAGRAYGQQVAADVRRRETASGNRQDSYRDALSMAFMRETEAAGATVAGDFLNAAWTGFRAELNRPVEPAT